MRNRIALLASTLTVAAGMAHAACVGTGALQTCNDASGNSYMVNRMGNMTMMNGSNAQTGSQWSETTNTMGPMTTYNGQTNGRAWNMTEQNYGATRTYNGTNADGEPFSYTCTQYGGCQ